MADEVSRISSEQNYNYADNVTIAILPIEYASDTDPDEQWVVVTSGAAWSPDWLGRSVEAIATRTDIDGRDYPAEYILDVQQKRYSWGADGAHYEILLWLAAWAATSGAWDVTKMLARTLAKKLKDSDASLLDETLPEPEAEERARWLVQARYKEKYDDLRVISVERLESGAATVVLRGASGCTYEVELHLEGRLVTLGRMKRTMSA